MMQSDRAPGATAGRVHDPAGPRATAAQVVHASWAVALEHATDQLMSPRDPAPNLLLVFASAAYGHAFPQLLQAARQRTGAETLVGCSVSGFLANDTEVEDEPGLALMACWLPGATLHPIRLHQEHVALFEDPPAWHEVHGIPRDAVRSWLVFAEPFRVDAQALVRGLHALYPGATIMGGLASGMVGERVSCVFFDDQVYDEGGVALGIGGDYVLSPHVSQGCEPIGEPWTITATEQNTILGISNRPALDVLQDTLLGLEPARRDLAQGNLVVGLAVSEYRDRYGRGDFLVRGILGIDAARGALVVGGKPRTGQTLQFHLREAAGAAADLAAMLAPIAGDPGAAVAAVLCTCDGRGKALFGVPHHDARAVRAALPGVPLAGAFCIGEIGPAGGTATGATALHGFTATLGLLRRDPS